MISKKLFYRDFALYLPMLCNQSREIPIIFHELSNKAESKHAKTIRESLKKKSERRKMISTSNICAKECFKQESPYNCTSQNLYKTETNGAV